MRSEARIEALRRELTALGEEFAGAAGPLLERALRRAVDRLVVQRAEWFNALPDDAVVALRGAVDDGVMRAGERAAARLRNPDLWLNPTIEHARPPVPELDSPNHRVWVALLNGADPLDPVFLEYGLTPSIVPDPGGGHFGLQPQTLEALDARGTLDRLWRRFVDLHERYRELLRRLPEERREQEREEARRRWRGGP